MLKKLKKAIDNIILKRKLIKLLNAISIPENVELHDGFCSYLLQNASTTKDYLSIKNILFEKILETDENMFPITYWAHKKFNRKPSNGSSYFFELCNWDIRRKWLSHVISEL